MSKRQPRSRVATLNVVATAALCLASCIPYSAPVTLVNPDNSKDVRFPGMLAALKSAPVVNVLVIHGMGTHDSTYAEGLIGEMQRQGKLEMKSPCAVVDTLANAYGSYSTVERCTLSDGEHELRLYVLVWSKLTEYFEDSVLGYDWRLHGSDRVYFDRKIKEGLIDTSFADAVIYSGSFAPSMRTSVERALCVLLTEKTRADIPCSPEALVLWNDDGSKGHVRTDIPPIFLISHSLGSIMVIETLADLSNRSVQPVSEEDISPDEPRSDDVIQANLFLRNVKAAYLLANQLPLIYLARVPAKPVDVPTAPFFHVPDAFGGRTEPLPVVAFSDANDLLTFPIPAGWRERILPGDADLLRIINVRVTNARYRWAGIVVNPSRAHTAYWTNRDVVKMMLFGH